MSLILEALRKSEAERRRAAVPDLLAEPQVATPVVTRAPQRLPWMLAGGAVAIALAWFVLANRSPAPLSVAPAEDDAVATEAIAEAPSPAAAQPQPTQAARPAPQVQRPLVVAAPVPAKPAESTPPAPKSEQVALDTPPPRIAPPVAAAAPPPAPVIDTTPRVTDLRGDERKQLPALKLSMHMWNDDAAQRFVIIDGTRLRVGDHLGALVVADILPDGVLLDWNGRPLKLPLR
jgi:general secretion pathway protein B